MVDSSAYSDVTRSNSVDPQLTSKMVAGIEAETHIGEGLNDEECEAELMALVVIDEFPIEAGYRQVTLLNSFID